MTVPTGAPTGGRSRVAAVGRLALGCLGSTLALLLVTVATVGRAHGRTGRVTVAVHLGSRIVLRSLGVRTVRRGAVRDGAALVVANHISWIDVLVIAGTTPVVPVAKCEVADWPLIGPVARRTGTVFVRRRVGRDLVENVDRIAALLRRGHRVLLFPEGTTTPGGPPGTFRRAGFQAAVDAAAPVQPVGLEYLDGNGRPTAAAAFVGDERLLGSVWRVLRSGPVLVRVRWPAPSPATVDGGHRARHRARAAGRAHGRISHALAS